MAAKVLLGQASSVIPRLHLNTLKTPEGRYAYYSFIDQNPDLSLIQMLYGTSTLSPFPSSDDINSRKRKVLLRIHPDKIPHNEREKGEKICQKILQTRAHKECALWEEAMLYRLNEALKKQDYYRHIIRCFVINRPQLASDLFLKVSSLFTSPMKYRHATYFKAAGTAIGLAAGLALGGVCFVLISSACLIFIGGLIGTIIGYLGSYFYVKKFETQAQRIKNAFLGIASNLLTSSDLLQNQLKEFTLIQEIDHLCFSFSQKLCEQMVSCCSSLNCKLTQKQLLSVIQVSTIFFTLFLSPQEWPIDSCISLLSSMELPRDFQELQNFALGILYLAKQDKERAKTYLSELSKESVFYPVAQEMLQKLNSSVKPPLSSFSLENLT